MAKKQIKHKPLSNEEHNKIEGRFPLIDLTLNCGARISEIGRLINEYKGGETFIDIPTKYSGKSKNRIWLNKKSRDSLDNLFRYKGMSTKTLQRAYKQVSEGTQIKFTSHNLRSTFATRLAILGVSIFKIQQLMNHSSIEQTAKYINLSEMSMSSSVDMLVDYQTIEGYTLPEAIKEIGRQREKLKRQEVEIRRLKGGFYG